jgi:hypothetical protein
MVLASVPGQNLGDAVEAVVAKGATQSPPKVLERLTRIAEEYPLRGAYALVGEKLV